MDEFIKNIKNKFSMENIVERLKDEIKEEKNNVPETLEKVDPSKIANIEEHVSNLQEQPKPSLQPADDMKNKQIPGNIQKKEPTAKTSMNVLQKPIEPEEFRDPFRDDENLFNFYD
ncbi:uncharacterized protein LOC123705338 [Colias croceus]|uniref:uncharacterized protein LOC123705338 n=1 Tax=Colias crocea TaxID=72248 RepID=UPI001E27ADF3|nr:uncharacterized protein LOC123705338 [Colias croceus]XP_045510037.1 uncharacterized protein LOC123705338 [Colias croceus]